MSSVKPLIIAHRGASGLETENTVASFTLAGQGACFGIETDLHVTGDGKYILIHDDNTMRVSGVDLAVEKTPFDRLREVSLFAFGTKTPSDALCPPTLAEYIRVCRTYDKSAVLELKNPIPPHHIASVVEEIRTLGWLDRTVFISFYPENMIALRNIAPSAHLQFLLHQMPEEESILLHFLAGYQLDLDAGYSILTADLVEKVHALGQRVNVWTVNEHDQYTKLLTWGVDYITTNYPDTIASDTL